MTRKDRTEGIYNRREVLDESERRQYCLIQLKDLLSYAYRYSEDVKKRFDRAQFNVEKFKTLSDIKHIPLLKKKELIFLQSIGPRLGGLLTKDIGELKRIFLSPGPIFDPEDRMDDYWGYTEAFYSVGFRPGDVVQVTFNYHLSPAGLMFEEPLRNLGCASIPAGPTDPGTQLDIMQKLRVSGYVGTASYLMHLAQKAEEKGINLRKDLFQEVAFVTGERLSEKMRNQLEKKFDIILRQGYGTADVGCIGYECFHKTGLHISNRCYVEICHPDTGIPLKDGEVGEIVVTSFNKTYPLIRLATGDLSYIDRAPCACGRTSPRLGSIVGRVDTTARIKGMFVYPSSGGTGHGPLRGHQALADRGHQPRRHRRDDPLCGSQQLPSGRRAAAPLPRTHQAASGTQGACPRHAASADQAHRRQARMGLVSVEC